MLFLLGMAGLEQRFLHTELELAALLQGDRARFGRERHEQLPGSGELAEDVR